MRSFYQKMADIKMVIFLGIIVVLWGKFVLDPLVVAAFPKGYSQVAALQLSSTKEAFSAALKGVQMFELDFLLYYDNYFALFYGLFLASLIAWVSARPDKQSGIIDLILFSIPLFASAVNLLGNNFYSALISSKGNFSDSLIFNAYLAALANWALIVISILIFLGYAVRRIIVRK